MSGGRQSGTRRLLPVTIAFIMATAISLTVPTTSGAFTASIANTTNTVGTAPYFHCADAVSATASSALFQWSLDDSPSSTVAHDSSGKGDDGTYFGTRASAGSGPIACPRDGGAGWHLDGSSAFASYAVRQTNPTVFTMEVWFRTTVPSGKLIGFGNESVQSSGVFDRHLYVNRNGGITFGVYFQNQTRTLSSPSTACADGQWHYAAASLSADGAVLYLDGQRVASDAAVTGAQNSNGFWRVGYDSQGGWPATGTNPYFTGDLRYAAIYTTALTASQISAHYAAGTGT